MAKLQKQMADFHEKIRLRGDAENRDLSEKRELLLNALRTNLNKDNDDPKLSYTHFNQGSYAMHTGTKPLNKTDDYDIDVGLVFDLNEEDHSDYIKDPVALKMRIKKALNIPQRTVNIRKPCVTVQYIKNGENDYHVDLAIYRESSDNADHLDLARGKEGSAQEHRYWDENDPKGLIGEINGCFPGETNKEKRAQMRRCIRYLKRWRDRQFSSGAPTSIALTCSAYHWFEPCLEYIPGKSQVPNDQIALRDLVATILSKKLTGRIRIDLPVHPNSDLLGEMTISQMENFIQKLEVLITALQESISIACPHEAAKKLHEKFGNEFEVPDKEDTGEKSKRLIVPAGTSA
jgi:hypothetical protein